MRAFFRASQALYCLPYYYGPAVARAISDYLKNGRQSEVGRVNGQLRHKGFVAQHIDGWRKLIAQRVDQ